jgi:flagellar motor switch protein FliG
VTQPAPKLTGARKAAILTLLVGEETSSGFFKYLQEDEIERIARELAAVGAVSPEIGDHVLDEFHQMSAAASYVTRGGAEFAQKLLIKALGATAARPVLDRVARSSQSAAGFTSLAKADPRQLSKFILAERPQTIALILAHLDTGHAAQVLNLLPDALRVDVLTRMATLDETTPDVIARISAVIEQRLRTLGAAGNRESYGGARAVAEVLNHMDRRVSQPVLETIEAQLPDLATSIRNLMFVFDDLLQVEDAPLREIVQRADRKVLMLALKGTTEEMRSRFLHNMSKRAGEMLVEEMEMLGAVRVRDVEKAQLEIVAIARTLEDEGLLATGAAAGEAYVV